jgi:hypothetical protein
LAANGQVCYLKFDIDVGQREPRVHDHAKVATVQESRSHALWVVNAEPFAGHLILDAEDGLGQPAESGNGLVV